MSLAFLCFYVLRVISFNNMFIISEYKTIVKEFLSLMFSVQEAVILQENFLTFDFHENNLSIQKVCIYCNYKECQ